MEDHKRTRSQGPLSMSEENELIQCGSIQDPVRIEREHSEACRLAREANTMINASKKTVEISEIPQTTAKQAQYTDHTPQPGEISPKQQEYEGHAHITPKSGGILPNQRQTSTIIHTLPDLNEIPPKEPQEVTDLVAMEEGERAETPTKSTQRTPMGEHNAQSNKNLQQKSPQIDTAQHYLDDNFSDVMRSSALGSNVSSLFNTTAFNTTQNEQKVTLDLDPSGWQIYCRLPSTWRKHRSDVSVSSGLLTILQYQ